MVSSLIKSLARFILVVSLLVSVSFASSCSGFVAIASSGGIFKATTYYYYSPPYAYIEGHRLRVYFDGFGPYVIFLGDSFRIRIYDDGRVWAPHALIILLD